MSIKNNHTPNLYNVILFLVRVPSEIIKTYNLLFLCHSSKVHFQSVLKANKFFSKFSPFIFFHLRSKSWKFLGNSINSSYFMTIWIFSEFTQFLLLEFFPILEAGILKLVLLKALVRLFLEADLLRLFLEAGLVRLFSLSPSKRFLTSIRTNYF